MLRRKVVRATPLQHQNTFAKMVFHISNATWPALCDYLEQFEPMLPFPQPLCVGMKIQASWKLRRRSVPFPNDYGHPLTTKVLEMRVFSSYSSDLRIDSPASAPIPCCLHNWRPTPSSGEDRRVHPFQATHVNTLLKGSREIDDGMPFHM